MRPRDLLWAMPALMAAGILAGGVTYAVLRWTGMR